MPQLPAHCRSCGATFRVNWPFGFNRGQGTFRNNIVVCPKCGGDANLVEGRLDIQHNSVKLLSGSPFDAALLDAFNKLVQEAVQTGNVAKLEQEAEKIHPDFGGWVRTTKAKNTAGLAVLMILLALINKVTIDIKLDIKVDINELISQLTSEAKADEPKKDEGAQHTDTASKGTSGKNPKIGH